MNKDRQRRAAHKANRVHGQETLKAQNLAREKREAKWKQNHKMHRQSEFGYPMEALMQQIDRNREAEFSNPMVELSKLLSKQEPLGKDFEKVLYDNLWDLYKS